MTLEWFLGNYVLDSLLGTAPEVLTGSPGVFSKSLPGASHPAMPHMSGHARTSLLRLFSALLHLTLGGILSDPVERGAG